MKKLYLSIMAIFLMYQASAQGNISNFNTGDYPIVSFSIHTYNPDTLNISSFNILEEGREAEVKSVTPVETEVATTKANILFLWDYRHIGEFSAEVLGDFFKNESQDGNINVNVSVFRRDRKEGPLYLPLMESFTSTLSDADSAVMAEYEKESKDWSKSSDIIWALTQAVAQMSALPLNEPKAIILLTTGKNNTDTGIETMPLISSAKKNRILIYTININGDEAGQNFCRNISEKTFGEYLCTDSAESYKIAEPSKVKDEKNKKDGFKFAENNVIHEWITGLPERWAGRTYKVSYTSGYGRIDKTKPITVKIGDDEFISTFDVPGFSLGVWISEHVVWFIVILILSLAAVGCGIYFLIRFIRNKAADKEEEKERQEAEQKRLKNEQEILKRKLEAAEIEQRRRQEQEQKKERDAKRQEYLDSLNSLMQSRNIKARILVSTMTGSYEYMMKSPEVTIGTAEDNMIVIEDRTVSRHHAILYFNGEYFGIKDRKSTNGIVMNGFKMTDMKLRNGDSVSLGNAMIKIYF